MDKETFENYKQAKEVIKLGEQHAGYFLHPDTDSVIFIAFFHKGIRINTYGDSENRILFDMFDSKNYQGPLPLPDILSEQHVLVNADHQDYAMLFKIHINKQTCSAKLTLEKLPEFGNSIITDQERNGIELTLQNE